MQRLLARMASSSLREDKEQDWVPQCPGVQRQAVAGKQMALGRSTLLLQRQSMPCWSNGIMTEMEKMATFLATQLCKAASPSGGIAMSV